MKHMVEIGRLKRERAEEVNIGWRRSLGRREEEREAENKEKRDSRKIGKGKGIREKT